MALVDVVNEHSFYLALQAATEYSASVSTDVRAIHCYPKGGVPTGATGAISATSHYHVIPTKPFFPDDQEKMVCYIQ